MLVLLLLAIFSGISAVDPNCTTIDATGVLILTPAATICADKASTATCDQLFNGGTALSPAPAAGGPEADRPLTCYQTTTPAAPSEEIKKAAIDNCPKYCGFCCVTPEYNCANAPNPRINCDTITQDMCQSTQWREIIAQDCPSACGFCMLGGCIDVAPDCETQKTICSNPAMEDFTRENCQRTCGFCGDATTAAPGGTTPGGGSCGDNNSNCANWVRNGFCTSTFYSDAQKREYCGTSCGLCGGK